MRIGILTGGGDVPGLNSAIKGLAKGALEAGHEVFGIRNGWQGLVACEPQDPQSRARWIWPMDRHAIRTIDRFGGTCLHSSRTNPSKIKRTSLPPGVQNSPLLKDKKEGQLVDATALVLNNLSALGIDVLYPIGGDDTLSYGERLHREGFPVVGIPKTMDNDVHGTDYCLGFATCVARSVGYIHQLRTSTGSHERFGVIEVMGRNSGATSLIPGYLASVDRVLIAEVPFDVDRLAEYLLADQADNPSRYAMVTVSEGARMVDGQILERGEADPYGHRKLGGIGEMLGDALKAKTGVGIIQQNLGYLVRSGTPDPIDVMVTFNFANLALELTRKKEFGKLVCLRKGCYTYDDMTVLSAGIKRVDVANMYDSQHYRPRLTSALGMPMYLY